MTKRSALLALALSPLALTPVAAGPVGGAPVGTWQRTAGDSHITLRVEEGRLHVRVAGTRPYTVHADYGLTKDRVLYGIVTSVESDGGDVEGLVDQTFRCNFRLDEGALVLRDIKLGEKGKKLAWAGRYTRGTKAASAPAPHTPSAAQLVEFLNANARRVRGLECKVDLDYRRGDETVSLGGWLALQKPLCFRVRAKVVSKPALDIGSDGQECWFWTSRAERFGVLHATYKELAGGTAKPIWPCPPDWAPVVLGVAELDPKDNYRVVVKPKTLELVRSAQWPRGREVRQVIVFNRLRAQVQVVGDRVEDAKGNVICAASVEDVSTDRETGAVLPRRLRLNWPARGFSAKVVLDSLRVNPPTDGESVRRLFTPPDRPGR